MEIFSQLAWRHPWMRPMMYPFFRLHPHPVFFLGNQKSGTTAISRLFAQASGKTWSTWLPGFSQPVLEGLWQRPEMLRQAIRSRARVEFSREVIKECNLTFFYPALRSLYPEAKMVFIVRDPRENLRSILNYLEIPGDLRQLPRAYFPKKKEWQGILHNDWMDIQSPNYIDSLAKRWVRAVETYLAHRDDFVLIRYEDFKTDKQGAIQSLCRRLAVPVEQDISASVDYLFQPRGRNKVGWETFFGRDNLERIEAHCAVGMQAFEYSLVVDKQVGDESAAYIS